MQTFTSPDALLLWSIIYALAAGAAFYAKAHNYENANILQSLRSSLQPEYTNIFSEKSSEYETKSQTKPSDEYQPTKKYEPIEGITTDVLIKRAYLFLEDGQFGDAERYFEQALNQDPEDSRIHFGQLMLARQAHNTDELINKLYTLLENEKLFQRALRFANDEEKAKLENYAQRSREQVEHLKLEKEAAEEKALAEREAEYERCYNEILSKKEKNLEIDELQELIALINSIRPYKDTNEIYNDIEKTLRNEKDYQVILQDFRSAKTSAKILNVIDDLEGLGCYKDTEELLVQANERLKEAEKRESKRNKFIISSAASIILVVSAIYGFSFYSKYAEEKARLAEIELARTNRIHAITLFFEGKNSEAFEAINSLAYSQDNPAVLNIAAYLEYEKSSGKYKALKRKAERLNESKNFYQEAIDVAQNYQGGVNADKFLGDAFLNGWLDDKNIDKALEYFEVAAENDDTYSLLIMSEYDKYPAKWYKKLADNGNLNAQIKLAEIFYTNGNFKSAAELYLKAADQDDPEAQTRIALMYLKGEGVAQDSSKAQEYFTQAANQGYPEAQENLAQIYDGIDKEKALNLYTLAAEQGMVYSRYRLGEINEEAENYDEALKWFLRAANDNKHALSQNKAGLIYERMQNYTEAAKFYLMASEQNVTQSQEKLARLYALGIGIEKNVGEAMRLYKRAAQNGSTTAQIDLENLERQINSENSRLRIAELEREKLFPVPGIIMGDKVNIRYNPTTGAQVVKQLNSGHPVSISRRSVQGVEEWYFIRTASGTEGWVRSDYVNLNEDTQNQHETNKRKVSLPSRGFAISGVNMRDFPTTQSSNVLELIRIGSLFTVYEIYAGPSGDWYRVRTSNNSEGWLFGRFVEFR